MNDQEYRTRAEISEVAIGSRSSKEHSPWPVHYVKVELCNAIMNLNLAAARLNWLKKGREGS